jgi:hypothetical protein
MKLYCFFIKPSLSAPNFQKTLVVMIQQGEQPICTTTKAKTSTPTVSKEHKVANKVRPHGKLSVRSGLEVPVEGEVAGRGSRWENGNSIN